ncbi:MAG: O-antigen ligase family protein [Deltaproteobacteria bacterium]|nr:O-antigen ligase family protein [Deltaproteobacteria bacterium]
MNVATGQVLAGYRPPRSGGRGVSVLGVVGLGVLGALLVLATRAGQEATAVALIVASMLLVVVAARPEIGILLLLTNYLFASYPTPIRGGGLLTINNVLGIILSVILLAELSQRPDFWFARVRQVQLYVLLGVVFLFGTFASYWTFPDLRITWGKVRTLDQTAPLTRDFVTRFAFVILAAKFLTTKRHIKMAMTVILLCLIMVVPSALAGWAAGATADGRAAAAFSMGTNSNRLAFLCLMQAAFWWYLGRTQRSPAVRLVVYGVIGALVLTVLLTASRSGFLGLGVLFYLLARDRGAVRGGRLQVVLLACLMIGLMLTVVPQENLDRIANLNPFAQGRGGNLGTHSTERRVETVGLGWDIFLEYPLLGIGLGNFREVARQVYNDPFYRPPHNSYIWALSEGGMLCFALFMLLYWVTLRDIRWLQRSPATPSDLRWIAAALEPSLFLLLFYSFFADMWLNPITYILIVLTVVFKRYVSCRRVVLV